MAVRRGGSGPPHPAPRAPHSPWEGGGPAPPDPAAGTPPLSSSARCTAARSRALMASIKRSLAVMGSSFAEKADGLYLMNDIGSVLQAAQHTQGEEREPGGWLALRAKLPLAVGEPDGFGSEPAEGGGPAEEGLNQAPRPRILASGRQSGDDVGDGEEVEPDERGLQLAEARSGAVCKCGGRAHRRPRCHR